MTLLTVKIVFNQNHNTFNVYQNHEVLLTIFEQNKSYCKVNLNNYKILYK